METLLLLKIRTQFKHLQNQAGVLLLVDKMRFQLTKAENNQFPHKFHFRVKIKFEVCGPGCIVTETREKKLSVAGFFSKAVSTKSQKIHPPFRDSTMFLQ